MTYLTPLRVISAGRIWVREGEGELGMFLRERSEQAVRSRVQELDPRLLLQRGGVEGVAHFGCGVWPGDGEGEERGERVEDVGDDAGCGESVEALAWVIVAADALSTLESSRPCHCHCFQPRMGVARSKTALLRRKARALLR